jgi:hypothetical protein
MTDAAMLRLVEEPDGAREAPEEAEPKVFARSIAAPAGAPWDQTRVAHLEARAGAPLPIGELVYQLRRLEPWRPGNPARFAAFYARSAAVGARHKTHAEVDGRRLEVTFVSRAEREREAKRASLIFAIAGGCMVVVLASIAVGVTARHNTEAQLVALEGLAAQKAQLAAAADTARLQSNALTVAGVRGHAVSDLLGDLDWAATAKAPGARIQAVHWSGAVMVVEARGQIDPFVAGGRTATRMEKPLRPGLWLWGVTKGADARVPVTGGEDVRGGP